MLSCLCYEANLTAERRHIYRLTTLSNPRQHAWIFQTFNPKILLTVEAKSEKQKRWKPSVTRLNFSRLPTLKKRKAKVLFVPCLSFLIFCLILLIFSQTESGSPSGKETTKALFFASVMKERELKKATKQHSGKLNLIFTLHKVTQGTWKWGLIFHCAKGTQYMEFGTNISLWVGTIPTIC